LGWRLQIGTRSSRCPCRGSCDGGSRVCCSCRSFQLREGTTTKHTKYVKGLSKLTTHQFCLRVGQRLGQPLVLSSHVSNNLMQACNLLLHTLRCNRKVNNDVPTATRHRNTHVELGHAWEQFKVTLVVQNGLTELLIARLERVLQPTT
jgi:hypothetical protein